MTPKTRRQTTRTALIFSLLALLIVSVGCKKETKIIPPPATVNELVGTSWALMPLYEDMPLSDKDILVLTFYKNNGNDSIKVTKEGNPFDLFFNGNKVNTNAFEYANGKGKVNIIDKGIDPINPINYYYSFTITNNVLEIQSSGLHAISSIAYSGSDAEAQQYKETIKNYFNSNSNIVFQNQGIVSGYSQFDFTQSVVILTSISTTKYKKQQ